MTDKERLELYRMHIGTFRQWLGHEFPAVDHVLATLKETVDGKKGLNAGTPHGMEFCTINGLREQLQRQASRATPADQEPVSGKDIWEYSFVHSSALGRPDEKVTMLTYEKVAAFRPECFDQKLVCSAGMFVAEVSQDSDGFKHIADVVELDDIPAGTRLYAITSGNLPAADHSGDAAEKVDAGSVPVASDVEIIEAANEAFGRSRDFDNCFQEPSERSLIAFVRRFAAPQAPQSEARSVRDAVIEECAAIFDSAGIFAQCGTTIRRLKSAPPQKPVSEDDHGSS